MELLSIVKEFEGKTTLERLDTLKARLKAASVPYRTLEYGSGTNVIVEIPGKTVLGISCHFDVVRNSPGANDNASAMAVVIDLINRLSKYPPRNFGVRFFFFDEEESGLKGSKAYVSRYGIKDMLGLINLDMVGMGNQLALWSLGQEAKGKVMEGFEEQARKLNVPSQRYDKIITHYADHIPFQRAGMEDAFTLTCISEKDKEVAYHYYKAQEFDVDKEVLYEILAEAPLFQNYHKPTDTSNFLNEDSLLLAGEVTFSTVFALDKLLPAPNPVRYLI